jgi:phage terminase large subunit-like protein
VTLRFTYDAYVSDVLSGKQVACQWVKLACERHVRDMREGADRGLTFDWDAANKVIAFCSLLKQSKGEWAGQPLSLEPWEQFILASIFGWMRHDGTRRFRTAIISCARKQGKSTLAAAVGLYMLVADNEPGAEIYSAATMRAQAQITHSEATRMVKASPQLLKIVRVFKDNIFIEDTASKFIPLGADSDTMDGLNAHCAIVDEIHAHKTRDTWDLLETATGSRRQPLMFGISTAGTDRQSLFWNQNDYTQKVLLGVIQNDAWFGIIYSLDEGDKERGLPGDDWQDQSVWCLSGDTKLYIKIGSGESVSTLQDLYKKPASSKVELWDGRNWVKLLGISKTIETTEDRAFKFKLRSGQSISATAHHEWPTNRGKIRTDQLVVGDIVISTNLPDSSDKEQTGIPIDVGWLVGIFLAEGSMSGVRGKKSVKRIQIHCNDKELDSWMEKIQPLVMSYGGTCHSHKYSGHRGLVQIESPVVVSIIEQYVNGINASTKYLTPSVWRRSNQFLAGIARGYLEGDAAHDAENHRYRLGFARNYCLADSLRTLASRLGARLRLITTFSMCNGQRFPSHKGEWRWAEDTLGAQVDYGEVIEIRKSNARNYYHIGVDNEDGLFALSSGVLSHNSKANPNLGVSKKLDKMAEEAAEARDVPSKLNAFQRLHLNMWTNVETMWLPVEHWKQCNGAVDAEGLAGRTCYGGLDLSSTTDITALVLVFPPQADKDAYQVLCRFWLPTDSMKERVKRDRVPYDAWVRQGYLNLTPGNTIDYSFVIAQIDADMQKYDLPEIAFDRWGASRIQTQLQEIGGKDFMVQFGQGFASMSAPFKEFEKLILSHRIAYGNNPVLNWMAHNIVAVTDPANNQKPDKSRSREKIDGVVALIMALDRATRHEGEGGVFGTGEMIIL